MITPEFFLICVTACFGFVGICYLLIGILDADDHFEYPGVLFEDACKIIFGLILICVAVLMVVL